MSEPPADQSRSENILTLAGMSIALSTLVFVFSSNASRFSFDFGPAVSLLTIIYHGTVLILSRRHRNSPRPSPYPTMRPSIGLAAFLFLAWLVTIGFMIVSLAVLERPSWWDTYYIVKLWAQFIIAVVEAGVLLSLVILCMRERKSMEAAEGEGRIQI